MDRLKFLEALALQGLVEAVDQSRAAGVDLAEGADRLRFLDREGDIRTQAILARLCAAPDNWRKRSDEYSIIYPAVRLPGYGKWGCEVAFSWSLKAFVPTWTGPALDCKFALAYAIDAIRSKRETSAQQKLRDKRMASLLSLLVMLPTRRQA